MLFYSRIRSLFDTSALNSFIAVRMTYNFHLVPQRLEKSLNAISHLGTIVKLGKVCKGFPLTVDARNFMADLIVLLILEFDVILGIDWLTKYGANLDCVSRSITFLTLGDLSFKF